LDYIAGYLAEHQRSPLIREIQAGCQIASYKSVMDRLGALERKGYIKRAPYKHRSVQLVSPPAEIPHALIPQVVAAQSVEQRGL